MTSAQLCQWNCQNVLVLLETCPLAASPILIVFHTGLD